MKSLLFKSVIAFGLAVFPAYSTAANSDASTHEVLAANQDELLAFPHADSLQESVATSMLGWGVGLTLAIGAVSALVNQSQETAHSSSDSS